MHFVTRGNDKGAMVGSKSHCTVVSRCGHLPFVYSGVAIYLVLDRIFDGEKLDGQVNGEFVRMVVSEVR